MKKEINFGVGFITGRDNICKIINSYYKHMIDQVKDLQYKVNFTFFILYDLNYLNNKKEDFYKIEDDVYKYIKIKYLDPEYVEEKNKKVMIKHGLTEQEANLIIGKGYAKARNAILYEAVEEKIDYLLFWDDDEYPLAAVENGKEIEWIKQNNILEHLKYIEDADITYGYRCGMISPLPYVEYNSVLTEDIYKKFISAMENEVISCQRIQKMQKNDYGIDYGSREISNHLADVKEMNNVGTENFVLGSGICLNLTHLDKIPAFYNPPEARGEDTFFSCALADRNAKVLRIPVYHFHDAFLKFTFLLEGKYPKRLKKIKTEDNVSLRFKRTTTGWTKYKTLFFYIVKRKEYKKIINKAIRDLKETVKPISEAFPDCDVLDLPEILKKYSENVEQHFEEYLTVNNVWNRIKYEINEKEKIKIGQTTN